MSAGAKNSLTALQTSAAMECLRKNSESLNSNPLTLDELLAFVPANASSYDANGNYAPVVVTDTNLYKIRVDLRKQGVTIPVKSRRLPPKGKQKQPESDVVPVVVDFLALATEAAVMPGNPVAPTAEVACDDWTGARLFSAHATIVSALLAVRELMADLGARLPAVSIE